jgi:aminoglycoside phosphotransferase (APT) family kinase protein
MKLDNETLAAGLGAATIVERGALPAADHGYMVPGADCEIVACRMPDGSLRQLFCKFGPLAGVPGAPEPVPPAHSFGVGYEAQVYDQLLPVWPDDVPRLHGALLDETTQTVGLALEYLAGATPLHQTAQPAAGLTAAARWIARFHRWSETAAVPSFLQRYDTGYYCLWMQRAGHFTRRLHERYPWLPDLCERCQRRLPALLPPATIIHGAYQAENILLRDGRNVTIDWDSAALAAGEIDLASLTWGWDDDLAALCRQQYCLARWPDGTPDDFALRLTAARVFLHLRRLGDVEEEEGLEERIVEVEELRSVAEKL